MNERGWTMHCDEDEAKSFKIALEIHVHTGRRLACVCVCVCKVSLLNVLSSFKDASLYQSPGSKCKPCPVVHPSPVCGTDSHTYSTKVPAHTITSSLTGDIWAHTHPDFYFLFYLVPSVSVAQCKLDYQACITGKKIAVKCPGMCPCPSQPEQSSSEKKGTHMAAHCKQSLFTKQSSIGSKPM